MDEIITIVSLLVGLTIAIIVIVAIGYLYSTKKKASFQAEESRKLMQLLSDGKIDQATYERMVKELKEKYQKT